MKRKSMGRKLSGKASSHANAQRVDELYQQAVHAHQAGKLARAERFYQKVLKANPKHPESLQYLGLIAQQAGHLERATRYLRHALDVSPQDPVAQNNLANLLRENGKFSEAIERYRVALKLAPDYVNACFNLAMCLKKTKDFDGAMKALKQVTDLAPGDSGAWIELGACQLRQAEEQAAEHSFSHALDIQPKADTWLHIAEVLAINGFKEKAITAASQAFGIGAGDWAFYFALGNLQMQLGDRAGAVVAYEKALLVCPESVAELQQLAHVLSQLNRSRALVAVWRRLVLLEPENADSHVALGHALDQHGQVAEAITAFEHVLAIQPRHAQAYSSLGMVLSQTGEHERAAISFRKALKLDPSLAEAGLGLASCRRFSAEDREDIGSLEALAVNTQVPREVQCSVQFALGKIHDDLGAYAQAFGYYKVANRQMGQIHKFDPEAHKDWVSQHIYTFDENFFSQRADWGQPSALPILIVGMPRSGTSLMEQIIASHPQVHGGGEMATLGEAVKEVSGEGTLALGFHQGVLSLDQVATADLARRYLKALTNVAGGKSRLTDKLPGNFLNLGLAALLVPGIKVIHCRRHPLDVCLSIYFQSLGFGNDYACDLRHIAAYYREYVRLMTHWRRVLPGEFLELDYEVLVADLDAGSKQLIAHCGLPWDERCLRFYENKRVVQTLSQWQVRQPVYTRSVERWKNYEGFLDELKHELGELLTT